MRWTKGLFFGCFSLFAVFAPAAQAIEPVMAKTQTPAFEITALNIHAEAHSPEACFVFSDILDGRDRAKLLAGLSLKSENKPVKVSVADLSVAPSEICIQNLEHRRTYELSLSQVVSAKGEKLAKPFKSSFAVADRKPSLSFVTGGRLTALPRHVRQQERGSQEKEIIRSGMAHVLSSVNVPQTHLSLYRVFATEAFAGAWQQFEQINLSPSESLTYARDKGELVFETDLVFGDHPNAEQTLVAPLPSDETLKPGLYYLAAAPREKGSSHALFAGQWFLVSQIHVTAAALPSGVQVFAFLAGDKPKEAGQADVFALAADGHVVAQAKTKDDGAVFMPLTAEQKKEIVVLAARTSSGDLDVIKLGSQRHVQLQDLSFQAFIIPDRVAYDSADKAVLTLRGEDKSGKAMDIGETSVKLVRQDRYAYHEVQVPAQTKGTASVTLSLPSFTPSTPWKFVWSRKDGSVLAEQPLVFKQSPLGTSGGTVKDDNGRAAQIVRSGVVGIKPFFGEKDFAENSVATFLVSTTDNTGRRRAPAELYYLIYEEGRSFEWFASEGHWKYRPLPNLRRIGGGKVSASGNEDAILRWPVTAGHYILDITNEQGDVLARYPFDAGQQRQTTNKKDEERLRLTSENPQLELKQSNSVKVTLAEPAMVSVIVTDGTVRQTHHKFLSAGVHDLAITPQGDWGRQILVRAEAKFASSPEAVVARQRLGLHDDAQDLAVKFVEPVSSLISGKKSEVVLQVSKNSSATTGQIVIAPQSKDGAVLPSVVSVSPFDKEGKARFPIDLTAMEGQATVKAFAWNEAQFISTEATASIHPALWVQAPQSLAKIKAGETVSLPLAVTVFDAPKGSYTYQIKVPDSVRINGAASGKINLDKGKAKTVPLSVKMPAFVDDRISLVLMGPEGFRYEQSWPVLVRAGKDMKLQAVHSKIEPQQTAAITAPPAGNSLLKPVALVTSSELPDVPVLLRTFVNQEPSITQDLALWLEVARLWEKPLLSGGLISEDRLDKLRKERLAKIRRLQNEDGGFKAQEQDKASDMQSTALAVIVLGQAQDEPAMAMAVEWLRGKLQNTWFEDDERAVRAFAFEALARIGRGDISALRYFAQTSQEKKDQMGPLALASLASALQRQGDQEAAANWYKLAMESLRRDDTKIDWPTLYWISQNAQGPVQDVLLWLYEIKTEQEKLEGPEVSMALATYAALAEKAGTWRMTVDGKEDKYFGLAPLALPRDAGKKLEIKNLGEKPIFVQAIGG